MRRRTGDCNMLSKKEKNLRHGPLFCLCFAPLGVPVQPCSCPARNSLCEVRAGGAGAYRCPRRPQLRTQPLPVLDSRALQTNLGPPRSGASGILHQYRVSLTWPGLVFYEGDSSGLLLSALTVAGHWLLLRSTSRLVGIVDPAVIAGQSRCLCSSFDVRFASSVLAR